MAAAKRHLPPAPPLPNLQPVPDYYDECNNLKVPEAEFRNTFCSRCVQPGCIRSTAHTGSAYDLRVRTWEDRLFKQVPRTPQDQAPEIAGQEFKEVNLTRWADPHSNPSVSVAVPARFEIETPAPTSKVPRLPPDWSRRNTPNPGGVVVPHPTSAGGTGVAGEKIVPVGARIIME